MMMPLSLEIYLDQNGYAEGLLYFDDGTSFRYQFEEEYVLMKYTYQHNKLQVTRLST